MSRNGFFKFFSQIYHFFTFLSSFCAITLLSNGQYRHVGMHFKALFMLKMIVYRKEYIDKLCTSKSQAATTTFVACQSALSAPLLYTK